MQEPFNQLLAKLPAYDAKAPAAVRNRHTESVAEVQQALIGQGYDGILLRNTLADAGSRDSKLTDWWIAFRPNQIKSAIGNAGRFRSDDARVTEQRRAGK